MIKTFCDICDKEITKDNEYEGEISEVCFTKGQIRQTISCSIVTHFSHPDNDICKYCLIDAINKLDNRPKCEDRAR